jgi:hypothetical protein
VLIGLWSTLGGPSIGRAGFWPLLYRCFMDCWVLLLVGAVGMIFIYRSDLVRPVTGFYLGL